MKHIKKRRIFLKKISYLFFAFIGFFTIKKFNDKNDYLSIFVNKINLLDSQKKNITKILNKYNYSHYQKFISDYKISNFNSFEDFSIWLSERIKKEYAKNEMVILENTFVSKTEVSLLIIKYG
tara:strand:- start:31 stop:399 length:369 start_codon:yes stop_codon:yes gene_type:complete